MGRSVSYPSGAHVAFAQWDAGWVEDDDNLDARHFDDFAARDEWDSIVEGFRNEVFALYPSAWANDGWIGREDRIVAANSYAHFGVSEYCGCIAFWVVLRDNLDSSQQGLAQGWFDRVAAKFEQRFATLTRLGALSNGEAVYQRITA